jgi:hypothetical protein
MSTRASMILIALLAVAACQSGVDDGVPPGGDGGRLPDADPADGGAADADPADAGPGADEDGDGVADVDDNCPTVANPGQLDDGETGAGGTADGVGDDCDPRPMGDGDSIAFFDGFGRGGLGAEWTAALGTWATAGGAVTQSSTVPTFSVLIWTGTLPAAARIDTEFTITTLPAMGAPTDDTRAVGVLGRYGTPAAGYTCVTVADPADLTGTHANVLAELAGATTTNLDAAALSWTMAEDVPTRVRFTLKDTASRQTCNLRRVGSGPQVTTTANDTTVTSGALALTTDGLAASFPYVIVYALGN